MRMPGDLLFIKTDAELLGSDTATSVKGKKLLEYLSNLRMRMQLLHQIAQENTKIAQENQAKQYDKNAKERSFCVGTKVLMYLSYVKPNEHCKTKIRYNGPFLVVSRVARDLYMLRHAVTMKLHKTPVNVCKLKLWRPTITNLKQFEKKGDVPADKILGENTNIEPIEDDTYELDEDEEDLDRARAGGGIRMPFPTPLTLLSQHQIRPQETWNQTRCPRTLLSLKPCQTRTRRHRDALLP